MFSVCINFSFSQKKTTQLSCQFSKLDILRKDRLLPCVPVYMRSLLFYPIVYSLRKSLWGNSWPKFFLVCFFFHKPPSQFCNFRLNLNNGLWKAPMHNRLCLFLHRVMALGKVFFSFSETVCFFPKINLANLIFEFIRNNMLSEFLLHNRLLSIFNS